jgi:hypothetical protein
VEEQEIERIREAFEYAMSEEGLKTFIPVPQSAASYQFGMRRK